MAKYNKEAFFQIPRLHFKNHDHPATINRLSLPAFKLYFWLKELEHRLTSDKKKKNKAKQDYFYRSDNQLVLDTGLSHGSIQKAKVELKSLGFYETWQMHWWIDDDRTKKSFKHVTAFRMR
jgi:hypothetical protein